MSRKLSGPDAARRRYFVVQIAIAAAFALAIIAADTFMSRTQGEPQRWLLAAAPVGVLVLWAREFFRVIRDDDEMMQALYLRGIAISGMLVLFGGTTWGMLERLLGVPTFPGFLLLPAFAALYGVTSAVLSRRV
jgi:hypothetical protein